MTGKKWIFLTTIVLIVSMSFSAFAAEVNTDKEEPVKTEYSNALKTALMAIAAAISMGVSAIACAKVQAAIGAGGTAALAEKPELAAKIFVLLAIPETIVILGFVMAYLILQAIGT